MASAAGQGVDDRPVEPHREAKSSGSESTYPDLIDLDTIRREVAEMAGQAVAWLSRKGLFARTVAIKVRYGDFTTITRSHTAPPTRAESELAREPCVCSRRRTPAGACPAPRRGSAQFLRRGDEEGRLPFPPPDDD